MDRADAQFWNQTSASRLVGLETTPAGLSQYVARKRSERLGPNTLQVRCEPPLIIQYLRHFMNPAVIILLAASAVSTLTNEIRGFVIIWAIVLMSVTLDFVQEYRAGRATERLKQTVAMRATVLRDGRAQEVPIGQLVPGVLCC